jgi:uncharacterized protein YjgD (DUF1641 family)
MDQTIYELNQKIDSLTAQVSYLAEQAQVAERQRQERAELMRDLTPIANQAFELTIEQLEEVQEYVDLSDLLRLFKRLLRNGRNIEKMLDQLESISELVETMSPMANEMFCKVVTSLADLEQKGYFALARGGKRVMDNVAATFTEEEINRMGENLVPLLGTVKDVARPQALKTAQETLLALGQEMQKEADISYTGLLRQLRDADVRRGIALTLRVLQVIGAQRGGVKHE